MKKHLLTLAISCLAAGSLRADLLWYEPFNYVNGPIIANGTNSDGTTNWFRHSGGATPSDSIVADHKLQVAASSPGNLARTDDVNRKFTTGVGVVYASFTVNCTNLPLNVPNGGYFAHFLNGASTFYGRVFATTNSAVVPNTWRLGISASSASTAPNKIYPVDLATNTDYQVVVAYDTNNVLATLWVNPISSTDFNMQTSDALSGSQAVLQAYAFRQAGSFGSFFVTISNLAVATSFDEAATNVWSTAPVSPVIVYQPPSRTNFVGDVATLASVFDGQGLGTIAYQWDKDGTDIPGATANVYSIPGAAVSDTGNYKVRATTPLSLSVTSAAAFLWVTNPPVPPVISQQPSSTNVFPHQNVALKVVASGPPPLTYQWFLDNTAVVDGPIFSGATSDTLLITDITAVDGTTGTYRVDVTDPFGTTPSANAIVTVTNPPAVSVAYLRTLVDSTFTATNTTQLWQVTGIVTTFTNITTANTASYYLQDGTGGINIFETLGQTFRPQQGDVVTWVGSLSTFRGTLELLADPANNPATGPTVLSNNIAALPAPKVIPYFESTNGNLLAETLEGTIVMVTNVYLGTNAGTMINTNVNNNPTSILVTNASGQSFWVGFAAIDQDPAGKILPDFAYSIVGPLTQDTTTHPGYQVTVTRFSDIVTDAPPAVTVTATHTNNLTTLSWPDVPHDPLNFSYGSNYSYSVLVATDVAGPYVPTSGYQANMLAANEVPGNRSTGIGFGTVELSPDETTITVNMKFSGLTANASAAHIHGPAAAGANAGVLFPFTGLPTATSGAIPQQTFAINATQVGYLKNGLLYMNVHTGNFPGGELRAQLLPVPSTGLTFTNTAAFYTDRNATNSAAFYRIVSP